MIFIENKYVKSYFSIIDRAKSRSVDGYTETHHIIPKSLGGDNSKSNLVNLTAREHYICHRLLTKMTEGDAKRKMMYAIWAIVNQQNKNQQRHKVTSRMYETLRIAHKEMQSTAMTGRIGPNTGKTFSEETRQKMSESAKKRPVSPKAWAAAIAARKGVPPVNKGKPMSAEQKEKIRQAALRRSSKD